jgi:secondary thiamine-phosphate synthase enzyme
MPITTYTESLKTKGQDDCLDLTDTVQDAVRRANLRHGSATIFVTGSTAGVTTIEYEPGLVQDLQAAVQRLFPEHLRYAHHESAGDDNGFSHLRASFLGPSPGSKLFSSTATRGREAAPT